MKFITFIVLLSSLCAKSWASPLVGPFHNYTVMIPEWEVEVSPGGPTVILKGTIEEIRKELLKLNPTWDTDYLKPKPSPKLARRFDFSRDKYVCRGRWPQCSADSIQDGINYLRGVSGQPTNGPGPGNCGRVSCSYDSAIWWCNDNEAPKTLGAFSDIADGAEFILDKCAVDGDVSGQTFTEGWWNVIVRKDGC